jgi:chaperonin GroEL
MGMNLIERDEFTATIQAISHIAAETVGRTLGPYAHTTIIDDGNFTYPTKDGWSILQRLRFQDPTHQSIFTMLKNISFRIVDKVGDGTTTAMVTADHFMHHLNDRMNSGLLKQYRQADIVEALDHVRDLIVKDLQEHCISIAPGPDEENPTYDQIYNVAYISSNGNRQLATIMQEIYQKTGNPNIIIDMDGGKDLSYEIQRGYRLDCSFLMHERYINTSEKYYDTMGNDHMLVIFDHNVSYQKHGEFIQALVDRSVILKKPLILMAPYYDDVMASMFTVAVQQQLKDHPNTIPGLMVIQIPEMTRGDQRNAVLDLAALANTPITTATKVKIFMEMRHNDKITDETDRINDPVMQLDEYHFATAQALMESCIGSVDDAVIGKNFFRLSRINTESITYKERYAKAKAEFEEAKKEAEKSPTSFTKAFVEASQRLNKLSGALGLIHVGGLTDLERQCLRDSVDDTFLACRSAYENGIVSGLNLGALASIVRVRESYDLTELENEAIDILYQSYRSTTLDIMGNKGQGRLWALNGVTSNSGRPEDYQYNAPDVIDEMIDLVIEKPATSYDIVTETVSTEDIPTVCNSVSTDIEILYGITSILGMTLTSDQYMSVSRMYDKTAATRQQEALNQRADALKVQTTLSSLNDWMTKNGDTKLATALDSFITAQNRSNRLF